MHRSALTRSSFALICSALLFLGCASTDTPEGATGSLSLDLVLAGDIQIDEVGWQITGNEMDMSGTIDVSAPGSTASVEVYGLPPGDGYLVELSATSVDGEVTCEGSAPFAVEVGISTDVMVILNCKLPQRLGGVRVNGKFNICAELTKMVVSPLQTSVGNDISLFADAQDEEDDPITYMWTSNSGSIADPMATSTTYTCTEVGDDEITVLVTDDGGAYCMSMWTVPVTCVAGEGNPCDGVTCEDDGNECTAEACNPSTGQCETSNVDNGTACNEGAGSCMDGECVSNDLCEGVTCEDDGNECTAEMCNPSTGQCETSNVDNGTACGDGGACMDGTCMQDLCQGVTCDDTGNDCTVAVCNSQTGQCDVMNAPNGTECNGGAGACSAGECMANNLCDGVDCTSADECVQDGTCDPGTGECQAGEPQPAGTSCTTGGGAVCDGAGNCVECNGDGDCDGGQSCVDNVCVTPPECTVNDDCADGNDCTQDVCTSGTCSNPNEANGTSCNGGAGQCTDGTCVAASFDFPPIAQNIDMCCNNNALPQQSIIPAQLSVDPGSAVPGGAFMASLGGQLTFPESFLDVAQTVVVGGVQQADLIAAQLTALSRGPGAVGPSTGYAIPPVFPPGTCLITATACDVANNTTNGGNTDCVPTGSFNPCQRLITVPTSDSAATCASLDPAGCTVGTDCTKTDQFNLNGFCVTGALPIPLQTVSGAYTAGTSGETMLWGWDDVNTSATIVGGVVTIGTPVFTAPLGPNGLKVNASGLSVAINCVMAVETGDPDTDPVTCGVTPDADLIGAGNYVIP